MEANEITDTVKEYINSRDSMVEQRVKYWVLTSILTNVLALIPVIFFLGGIYQSSNAALEMIAQQQVVLQDRGGWMEERERWEFTMQAWAESKGYVSPATRYRVAKQPKLPNSN